MKKSKVDRLIRKHAAEAREAGRLLGRSEERARYEETIYAPNHDGMIWLGHQPPTKHYYTIAMPRGYTAYGFDSKNMSHMFIDSDTRIEFRLKQKGIAFANGVSVRWADWEPMGPYPVINFADPPRYR